MSSKPSSSSLDEAEAELSVEERLQIRGRGPVALFDDAELLYYRFKELAAGTDRIPPKDIQYPGSDGMSVNRGRFSLPNDVLWPSWRAWGVAEVSCGEVRGTSAVSGDNRNFSLSPRHDPLEADEGKGTPENYAHTLIVTTETPAGIQTMKPPAKVKKDVRLALASLFRVVQRPR